VTRGPAELELSATGR